MPHTFETPRSQAAIEQLLELIKLEAFTRDQLQVAMRKSKPTLRRYLDHLMSEPRRVFIAKWIRTEGNLAPAYRAGNRKDAKRPTPPSKRDRNVQRWQRIKTDPTMHQHYLRRHRLDAALRRVRTNPQTWLSALQPGPVGSKLKEKHNRSAE